MENMSQSMKIKKISLSPLRQIIRDRMNEFCKIPQFCLEIEVNMKKILEVREKLVLRPSITACLVWSCARALREKPELNGYFYGDEIGHTSVADHRALDGAVAADFLSVFKRICEGEFHKGDWL